MMKNEDTRVQFTKKILKDALLKLLKTKPITRVTIKELCEEAGLNRGTFYLHYNEPNDLLREIEEEFVQEKMSFFNPYMKNDNPDQLAMLFGAILQNHELSLILFGHNGAPQFTERIKKLVRPRILEDWQREFPTYHPDDLEFVYDFVFSGAMKLILNWIADSGNISAEEFAHRLDCLGHYSHLAIKEFR
ncbi:MAG: TetR/AcrR family transcriptional regulator C-terminal domain-containing protein [Parasporobacterium sp.]|nr:TetR/AcrR family transcriptional regulator C-terminal domain-containing protein [Parasporobacterium sp.]